MVGVVAVSSCGSEVVPMLDVYGWTLGARTLEGICMLEMYRGIAIIHTTCDNCSEGT